MMRFILRMLSVFCLAAAVVAGTADTIQSFAADTPVLTPGLTVVDYVAPNAYASAQNFVAGLPDGPTLRDGLERLIAQPAFALLLGLALIFWMLGYKKPKPAGRFAA